MNVNEIRKIAKECRTGACERSHQELAEFFNEACMYSKEKRTGWSLKFQLMIDSELNQIRSFMIDHFNTNYSPVTEVEEPVEEPVVEEAIPEAAEEPVPEVVEEPVPEPVKEEAPAEKPALRRKAFKTVLREMAGEKDPVLAAVKWFVADYRLDGCEKSKCAKGMLKRRGYNLKENPEGFDVLDASGNVAAVVTEVNGVVDVFALC